MSWLKNPKKALVRNFSLDSWKRGKGFIGFYNPIMKVRGDVMKIARKVKSTLKPVASNTAFSSVSNAQSVGTLGNTGFRRYV